MDRAEADDTRCVFPPLGIPTIYVAQVNRSRAFMPPATAAPFIMRFDAESVAVGCLVFSTDGPGITLGQMQDQALNRVRPAFATLPGVSAPPPFLGKLAGDHGKCVP